MNREKSAAAKLAHYISDICKFCMGSKVTRRRHSIYNAQYGSTLPSPTSRDRPMDGWPRRRQPPKVKAGGAMRLRQATAFSELTLCAALTMSAATASGFERYIAWLPAASAITEPARVAI